MKKTILSIMFLMLTTIITAQESIVRYYTKSYYSDGKRRDFVKDENIKIIINMYTEEMKVYSNGTRIFKLHEMEIIAQQIVDDKNCTEYGSLDSSESPMWIRIFRDCIRIYSKDNMEYVEYTN